MAYNPIIPNVMLEETSAVMRCETKIFENMDKPAECTQILFKFQLLCNGAETQGIMEAIADIIPAFGGSAEWFAQRN